MFFHASLRSRKVNKPLSYLFIDGVLNHTLISEHVVDYYKNLFMDEGEIWVVNESLVSQFLIWFQWRTMFSYLLFL